MKHPTARDEGSALVMALIFVMVTSIILGALLTFAQTTQRTTVALRDEAASTYQVDGAVQQAINTLQRGAFINDEGSVCFTASETGSGSDTDTMVIPDPDGTGSIAVVCEGTPGSGVQSPEVPLTTLNKPGNAILTLGSTEGVYLDSTYNSFSTFNAGGPVFSNGPIRTNGRTLNAREYVIARGACPDAAKITPAPQCNYTPYDVRGVDPNYALPATVPTYQKVPSPPALCLYPLFGVITFEPGYYDDADALNKLTNRNCAYHFKPGTYYFDFHNGDNSALPTSSHEWRITNGRLIGGTRTGALSLDCVSPLKSTTNNGVKFVFGGNSRLTVTSGASAAICGTYSASVPAIAIHGAQSGTETSQSIGLVPTGQSSVASFTKNPGGQANLAWQGMTAAGDSVTAQWSKTGTSSQTGHLALTGYVPAAAVPAGSVIDSATVQLRRSNTGAHNNDTRAVVLTVAGKSCTLTVPDAVGPVTENLNVLTGCPAAFVADLHASGVPTSGTSLRYNVTLTRAGVEILDQLTLDITYRAPAFRSQQAGVAGDSCRLGNAYIPDFAPGGPTGCAALDMHLGSLRLSTISGTVYTPHSSVVMEMNAVSASAFRSGVISRSFYLQTTGILNYASVASIPFSSAGTDPSAYLTAYVCETGDTCSAATGVPQVRAKVTLVGQNPDVPRREAKIVSYSVLQ